MFGYVVMFVIGLCTGLVISHHQCVVPYREKYQRALVSWRACMAQMQQLSEGRHESPPRE